MRHSLIACFAGTILTLHPLPAASISDKQVEVAAKNLLANARREMKSTGIPGMAIAVVFEGKVLLAEGLGVREVGTTQSVDPDTVFQLASISKPIGSTVIAALVGKKIVSWDSRLSDLDPSFAMSDAWVSREIQICDLYSHRSGLPAHAGDLLEDLGYSQAEILHRLRFLAPEGSFRAHYAYTNFGLTAAAVAVAKAAGKDWATLSEDVLYKPLGMKSTSSRYADFIARPNRASGHQWINGKWVHTSQRQPDAQSPAGGVSSSINDLVSWMQLQLQEGKFHGRSIVSEAALAETHLPFIRTGIRRDTGQPTFYGLGWDTLRDSKGRLRLSHSGAFAMGASTFVALLPEQDLGVVILTNASPLGVPEGLGNIFLDEALEGSATEDWLKIFKAVFARMMDPTYPPLPPNPPKIATPALAGAAYAGTYANDFFGQATVTSTDKGLVLSLGPEGKSQPLIHWDRDIFAYDPIGEMATGPSPVIFTVGPDGTAREMKIEHLDVHGAGTFRRETPANMR